MEGIEIFGLASLSQMVALFRGDPLPVAESVDTTEATAPPGRVPTTFNAGKVRAATVTS